MHDVERPPIDINNNWHLVDPELERGQVDAHSGTSDTRNIMCVKAGYWICMPSIDEPHRRYGVVDDCMFFTLLRVEN